MGNNDLDSAIQKEAVYSFKTIANSFSKCNHKYLYKYQSFKANYIDKLIESIDSNSIFLSKLSLFEKDDITEYQLDDKDFKPSIKQLIKVYNDSTIRDTTKIICLSYKFPNNHLIENYSKNFGFVVKYNAKALVNYLNKKCLQRLIYGNVKYVDNKSAYIAKEYNETFDNYIKKLEHGIKTKDDFIFSKLTGDVIRDISYYLNSTNFLIKENKYIDEQEFRFVFTNYDECEEYIYFYKTKVIEEIIILDSPIALQNREKMMKLIDVCKKNNIKCRMEKSNRIIK